MKKERYVICNTHGELSEDQIRSYVRNRRGRSELTFQCKLCHRASAATARNKSRKDYRDGLIDIEPKANIASRLDRKLNPEKHAEWSKRLREKLGSFRNVREISRIRGITTDKYLQMLAEQDNKCAICSKYESRINRNGTGQIAQLCLDHHHASNKVREFLCHNCNTMIGKFFENISFMQSAIQFLNTHGDICQK